MTTQAKCLATAQLKSGTSRLGGAGRSPSGHPWSLLAKTSIFTKPPRRPRISVRLPNSVTPSLRGDDVRARARLARCLQMNPKDDMKVGDDLADSTRQAASHRDGRSGAWRPRGDLRPWSLANLSA